MEAQPGYRKRPKAVTLALLAATAFALCLVAAYASGRFPWLGLGYVSSLFLTAWLLLLVAAGATLTEEVLFRRLPVRTSLFGIGLLLLLAVPLVHAFLPGPELNDLVAQRGFHQYMASQVSPTELHAAVTALLANRRAEGKESVAYGNKEKLASLPKAVRRLHPSGVMVEVPSNTVRIRWGRGLASWQIVVTPATIQVDDSARD